MNVKEVLEELKQLPGNLPLNFQVRVQGRLHQFSCNEVCEGYDHNGDLKEIIISCDRDFKSLYEDKEEKDTNL